MLYYLILGLGYFLIFAAVEAFRKPDSEIPTISWKSLTVVVWVAIGVHFITYAKTVLQ